jgi:hypothetical protein
MTEICSLRNWIFKGRRDVGCNNTCYISKMNWVSFPEKECCLCWLIRVPNNYNTRCRLLKQDFFLSKNKMSEIYSLRNWIFKGCRDVGCDNTCYINKMNWESLLERKCWLLKMKEYFSLKFINYSFNSFCFLSNQHGVCDDIM